MARNAVTEAVLEKAMQTSENNEEKADKPAIGVSNPLWRAVWQRNQKWLCSCDWEKLMAMASLSHVVAVGCVPHWLTNASGCEAWLQCSKCSLSEDVAFSSSSLSSTASTAGIVAWKWPSGQCVSQNILWEEGLKREAEISELSDMQWNERNGNLQPTFLSLLSTAPAATILVQAEEKLP